MRFRKDCAVSRKIIQSFILKHDYTAYGVAVDKLPLEDAGIDTYLLPDNVFYFFLCHAERLSNNFY